MDVKTMRTDAVASIGRILEAAWHVFGTDAGTGTLEKIAHEAGVGIATLYRHFPSRQVLARAVYERLFVTEIEPLLRRAEAGDGRHEELLDVAMGIVQVGRRERGVVTSIGDLTAATTELLADHLHQFDALVGRGKAAGNLRADLEGKDVAHVLAMFATGAVALSVDALALRRYLGMLLDGLQPQVD